jgi:predicted PurR-regulated permease PerM
MNNEEIDPKVAYKKTLNGILITFIIFNIAILAAVAIGFWYTMKKIDETSNNINNKIDKSYENTAKVANAAVEKMSSIGSNIEKTVQSDVQAAKEKGKEILMEYLKAKGMTTQKSAQQGDAPEPASPAR